MVTVIIITKTLLQTTVQDAKLDVYKLIRTYCSCVFINWYHLSSLSLMKSDIKKVKGGSQIVFLLLAVLSATLLGNLLYDNDNTNKKNNLRLLSLPSLPSLPPVQASVLNTSSLSNNMLL